MVRAQWAASRLDCRRGVVIFLLTLRCRSLTRCIQTRLVASFELYSLRTHDGFGLSVAEHGSMMDDASGDAYTDESIGCECDGGQDDQLGEDMIC